MVRLKVKQKRQKKQTEQTQDLQHLRQHLRNLLSHHSSYIFFLLFLALFFLDRATKAFFYGKQGCFLFFCLTKATNTGSLLGLFSESSIFRIIAILLSLIIIILVSFFYFLENNKTFRIAIFFVLAGVISNLFDRLFYGNVLDWLALGNLFSFNLADCYICTGLILLIVLFITNAKSKVFKG